VSYLVEFASSTKYFVERGFNNIIHKLFYGVSKSNKAWVSFASDIYHGFGQKLVCVCPIGRNEVMI